MKKLIHLLAGTRPNYMKIFPLWSSIKARHPESVVRIIHTGQHYDARMSDVFFADFDMPEPDYFLNVGSGSHATQTAKVMMEMEALLLKERPDVLVVVGDVNSTMAGALTAVKLGIAVAHVEAGLRSGDRSMPEEINRIVTDGISDWLFTSCRDADRNLLREGADPAKIHFVGNLMIDSLKRMLPRARKAGMLNELDLQPCGYSLVTLHRPSNVDHPDTLSRLLAGLVALSERSPVVFPVHPRTRQMLQDIPSSASPNLKMLDPVGYVDFLCLQSQAELVVTDSGGIQEETTYLGIPCLTVRANTERPVTITEGSNRLVDPNSGDLFAAALDALSLKEEYLRRARVGIEGWDGEAAVRTVDILCGDRV